MIIVLIKIYFTKISKYKLNIEILRRGCLSSYGFQSMSLITFSKGNSNNNGLMNRKILMDFNVFNVYF